MDPTGPQTAPGTRTNVHPPPYYGQVAPAPTPSAPPSEISTQPAVSEVDVSDDFQTLNIHITINVPKSLALPFFQRSRYACRGQPRQAAQHSSSNPKTRRRVLSFFLVLFYTSFVACGGAAWGVKNRDSLWMLSAAPLIISTFSPFVDLFVVVTSIRIIRRHVDGAKPAARYLFLVLANLALFALHLTILIIMAVVARRNVEMRPWSYAYGGYYSDGSLSAVAGLVLYSSATMVLFKLILAIVVLARPSLRRVVYASIMEIPRAIGDAFAEDCRYEALAGDVDGDAKEVATPRQSVEQGRIALV